MLNSEINMHLAAGRYYGKNSTCGSKVKFPSEESANRALANMKMPRHELESYPCYFCSPGMRGDYNWHNGRAMTATEKEIFTELSGKLLEMEDVILTGGQLLRVHNRKLCEQRNCCIHSPSGHHMVTWPMNWRQDSGKMERTCPHGIGHPDPDDYDFQMSIGNDTGTHGCDGCCSPPMYHEKEKNET